MPEGHDQAQVTRLPCAPVLRMHPTLRPLRIAAAVDILPAVVHRAAAVEVVADTRVEVVADTRVAVAADTGKL